MAERIILNSLTAVEYEILHALIRLKEDGKIKPSFALINVKLNSLRKRRKEPEKLSRQAMNYHIKKLAQRPFIQKERGKYMLVEGYYKLNGVPTICMRVSDDAVQIMILCSCFQTCSHKPFTLPCLKNLEANFPRM